MSIWWVKLSGEGSAKHISLVDERCLEEQLHVNKFISSGEF